MKRIHLILAFLAVAAPVLAGDFPKGSPKFEHSYEAALSEAKKTGKPAILVFSAAWCGPCQAMKKDVYPSSEVTPFHDKFVWAYLDVDESSNEKAAGKFGVKGIPHIQFVNAEGKPVDKQVGSSSASSFAKTLASVLKKAGAK
jgi:thioredoxin 1